ncbi:hypothetical protein [Blastopirellula marina]|uniref:Uncharacterized protein n=1 Tax=Blastopirellula marina TaxID=124 RepID=A0A2S8GRF1_9BACT|nr:hypothetical protein [Blastopirellula marina]PQO46951.1 hypothetical protein C5Y93_07315 [Blastopirellula marina]
MSEDLQLEEDLADTRRDPPPVRSSPRWRFSITRLILATAVAPLPFWMAPTDHESAKIALAVSSLAVAGAILLVRARDLPRINASVTLGALAMILLSCCCPLHMLPLAPASGLAIGCLLGFVATEAIFPSFVIRGRAMHSLSVKTVLKSGLIPFLIVCLIATMASVLAGQAMQRNIERFVAIVAIDVVLLLLLVFNFDQLSRGVEKTLDERPGLGYLYEATTILIPVALLILYFRYFASPRW